MEPDPESEHEADQAVGPLVDDARQRAADLLAGVLRQSGELAGQTVADQIVEGLAEQVALPEALAVVLPGRAEALDQILGLGLAADHRAELGADVRPQKVDGRGRGPQANAAGAPLPDQLGRLDLNLLPHREDDPVARGADLVQGGLDAVVFPADGAVAAQSGEQVAVVFHPHAGALGQDLVEQAVREADAVADRPGAEVDGLGRAVLHSLQAAQGLGHPVRFGEARSSSWAAFADHGKEGPA